MMKSTALRLVLVCGAATLALSACNRPEKEASTEAPASAASEGPLTYSADTPYAKVSLSLPEAVRSFPELYADLYDGEVGALKDYAEGAQADRSEFGGADFPPYEKAIVYGAPVETERLFSMVRSDFDYSGGAHPNTFYTGVLWDKQTAKRLTANDLLASDGDRTALRRTLCEAINTAKKARPGAQPVSDSGTWTCPDLKDVQLALSAGDTPKKAAGLTFLINHYEVGPYVEGAYFINLPVAALGRSLNPAFASEFGGTGATGDVTNTLQPE